MQTENPRLIQKLDGWYVEAWDGGERVLSVGPVTKAKAEAVLKTAREHMRKGMN